MARLFHRLLIASVLAMTACVSSIAGPANAGQIKVLILGDSVASVLRWSPTSMKALWKKPYAVTLEVWGCQKLVDAGCIEGKVAQKSALELLRKHRGKKFDFVVVATGYNDTGATYLQKSIRRIHAEVSSQGAQLMWLTYRENGNVKIKARAFNKVVKTQAKRLKFHVLDWATISMKQRHWFTGDAVHMNAHGGIRLGNHIRRALDAVVNGQPISTTTIATTTTVPANG
ncbi:MAG: SGNH/GDSL hydrolase family protein [Ilumatobacteraceae bacterium]